MQRYRPPPGKSNPNVKEIAKRWDLYPKSGNVSVPQLCSIFEAVRKGAEEALSKTLDDNDLEQAICKVAQQICSKGKVLPYVSWLVKEQPIFQFHKDQNQIKVHSPNETQTETLHQPSLFQNWSSNLPNSTVENCKGKLLADIFLFTNLRQPSSLVSNH